MRRWQVRCFAGGAACLTDADLFRAVQDLLTEADASRCEGDPDCTAQAHEAASALELWLRHMASDFRAIDDLAAGATPDGLKSRVHFPLRMRRAEIKLWEHNRIETRSYATISRRAFLFEGETAPRWDILNPWTYPACTNGDGSGANTDIVYRTGYRACAGGPFNHPAPPGSPVRWLLQPSWKDRLESWGIDRIQLWDNDGIVNTASMFWPHGTKTLLVPGDHMDIVGHYMKIKAIKGTGRTYGAYDLLKSASGFDHDVFEQVWNSVFDFCLESAKKGGRRRSPLARPA